MDDWVIKTIVGGLAIVIVGLTLLAVWLSSMEYIPSEEERKKLMQSIPEGCTVTDIGRYASIDNLLIITCQNKQVNASYTVKKTNNGKSTTTDSSAVFIITG